MKLKTIRYLTLILIFLVALFFLRTYLQTKQQNQPSPYQQISQKIKPDSLNQLDLNQADQNISLTKKDNDWYLNDQKADNIKINQLLNLLLSQTDIVLIAQTNNRHQDLNLTADQATRITLKAGGQDQLTLLVGRTEPNGAYARLPDQDQVYLIPNLSFTYLDLSESNWLPAPESSPSGEVNRENQQ